MMPEISVVVPVYKVEPYLRQCVDSVLVQTFADFELILVDDGSPDNCGAICDEYAVRDSRIRVIHQENAGQGKARNVGMDQAVGKYIIFLDSDDYWLPSALETLYSEAERNQTQVLAFGAIVSWEGIEKPEGYPVYRHTVLNGIIKTGPESLKEALNAREYYVQPWSRFYLLGYVRENGFHFDEGVIFEDLKFSFLSYLYAERVECIDAQLYMYRKRTGSTLHSRTILSTARGNLAALDGLLHAYECHPLSPLGKELLERFIKSRIQLICILYEEAQKQSEWRTARWIRKDAKQILKGTRALPSLPRSLRLATYSLFLYRVARKAVKTVKRFAPAGRRRH